MSKNTNEPSKRVFKVEYNGDVRLVEFHEKVTYAELWSLIGRRFNKDFTTTFAVIKHKLEDGEMTAVNNDYDLSLALQRSGDKMLHLLVVPGRLKCVII